MMKRLLVIIPIAVLLIVGGAIFAFNLGLFQDRIQAEAQSALGPGTQVRLGAVKLLYRWPPLLRIGTSEVNHPQADLRWKSIDVEILKLSQPYAVSLHLFQPTVTMKSTPADGKVATPAPSTASGSAGASAPPPPLSLKVQIVEGQIQADAAQISNLNLNFEQKLLLQSPAAIHASGAVKPTLLPVPLPWKLDTDTLTLTADSVKASQLQLSLGGLNAKTQGSSLLREGKHHWVVEIAADDLAKIPQPTVAGVPAKNWRGQLQFKVEASKNSEKQPWQAEGNFLAKGLAADLDYAQNQMRLRGPMHLDAEGKFTYQNEKPGLPDLTAVIDLKDVDVQYLDMLNKPAGVPMMASAKAGGDPQKINVQQLQFQLWNFAGQVSGVIDGQAPYSSQLQFNLKPVNLAGSEKFLLPLRASPVRGELSLKGHLNGPLADPMKVRVVVEDLSLKKFAGEVNYEREGTLKMRGPVQADIQAKVEWANEKLKSAEGRGVVDLSMAALVMGPLRKDEKALFKARFNVRNEGNSIRVDEVDLSSFVGNLSAKGKVEQGALPQIDMNVAVNPLLLSELRIAMPSMRDLIPKGTVNGRWQLTGKIDTAKPWSDWPLKVSGSVDAHIPEYKMPTEQKSAAAAAPPATNTPAAPTESTSFLPDGALTRQLSLNIKARVDQFIKEPLQVRAITSSGAIAAGHFKGQVQVGQVFGGSVHVKNLDVPLLQAKPKIQGHVDWLNIVIEDALAFAKPEYKTMASGKTGGVADFVTVMPDQTDFMNQLRVRGDVGANPVTFNSVKIGEMINAQIAKVPALKLKPAKVEPLRGQAKAEFDLAKGVVDLPRFQGTDVDNSEIQLKGKVVLSTMEGDLAGTFYWNDPPVKGCALEGNADAKGRMIVPLAIKGDLMKPGFNILSDVIGKLAGKTLECEGKKLLEKAKSDGKQQLEKELKKTLKGIFGK